MKPGELERLSMAFDRQMHELEIEIMSDIVRRIKINGEVTRAADWQINRLYELGMAKKDIKNAIQKHLQLSDDEIEQIFRDAAKADYARNADVYKKSGKELIPFEENETLKQLVSSVAEQTGGEVKNISQSLGFAVRGADGKLNFKPIAKYYQDALDKAITGIATGAFDYNTALKKAVAEMVKSGLRVVDYGSGWSNRVEVAARRAVMTGFSQITGKINEQNAEELETDMYEVTWHGGARPSHQVWQGRWYTKAQLVSVCGLGTVTGLHGANCYHDYYPVVPGVSEPTYTEAQLKEMNAKENTPVEYCGKPYTKYEALQRQRKLETTMRAQRQQIKLLEDGGADEDDIINTRCRYRGTSQEYSRFSKAIGIPQQRERVTVDGLGNIGVGKWKITGEKIEAPFPKGYKDKRNVGKKISAEQLHSFAEKAESIGVKLGTGKEGTFGGFEEYKGDVFVLDYALEHIRRNQPILTKISGDDKIILKYGNVLDDFGRIDTGAFAWTKGRTITLNKFMYDDTAYLMKEYSDSTVSGHFAKGTDYKNILDHEIAHVFAHQNKSFIRKINRLCEKKATELGMTKSEYILSYISKYADDDLELLSEINSMYNGSESQLAKELFKEIGLI